MARFIHSYCEDHTAKPVWSVLDELASLNKLPQLHTAIGEIEVERLKESRSMRLFGSRKSYAMEIATKPLVMVSEISGLEPLHGFIKQENRVVPVHFQFARKHGGQPEFIERKLLQIAPRQSLPTLTTTARAEQPKTPAAAQATLPLFDVPTDKPTDKTKEAFV